MREPISSFHLPLFLLLYKPPPPRISLRSTFYDLIHLMVLHDMSLNSNQVQLPEFQAMAMKICSISAKLGIPELLINSYAFLAVVGKLSENGETSFRVHISDFS
ncbi:hypothetical protein YC2023_116553 [Brassica napus]